MCIPLVNHSSTYFLENYLLRKEPYRVLSEYYLTLFFTVDARRLIKYNILLINIYINTKRVFSDNVLFYNNLIMF